MKYGQKCGGKSRKIGLTLSSGNCRILISSQKGRKLAPQQKVLKQLCWDLLCWGWKSHFFQKIAFFGQKMRFFQKNYFIQNWSVIKTTSYTHAKKIFFYLKFWDRNFHQILPTYQGLHCRAQPWFSVILMRFHKSFANCVDQSVSWVDKLRPFQYSIIG